MMGGHIQNGVGDGVKQSYWQRISSMRLPSILNITKCIIKTIALRNTDCLLNVHSYL